MNRPTISEAFRRMVAARTAMLFDSPFWGMLSSRLQFVEDPTCPTAWTDGVSIGFNPAFVSEQTHAQLIALVAHETEHCARGHPWRRDGRESRRFNVAADISINPDLRDNGFTLPDGVLYPEQYELPQGKSSEWYYDRVPEDAGQSGGQGKRGKNGDEQQDDSGTSVGDQPSQDQGSDGSADQADPLGEVRDAPNGTSADGQPPVTEADWQQAVNQAAAVAFGQGKLPAGVDRLVEAAKKSRVDWRSATLRFAQEVARGDYSWSRPNPRYLPHGLYMPALRSHEVGIIVIVIDTSGSIDKVLLEQFGGVVQQVADEVQPREVRVLHCDAEVAREETFVRGEPIVLHPAGGGGTDFRPAFDRIAEWEERPACVLYLTDLYGTFPEADPGIPTLWVVGRETTQGVPFGELLCAA